MKAFRRSLSLAVLLSTTACLNAQEVLKAQGSEWEYLLFKNAIGNPIDPNNFDADFHTTWQDPVALGYDGPAFSTGTGYFGYGTINGSVITTNIWNPDGSLATNAPPSGSRYTNYFRTTITPTNAVSVIRFTGIVDDGAIIYLDGVEVARINMAPTAPEAWLLTALNATNTEDTVSSVSVNVSLPANVPVTVGVSVHNTSATSSDMGFDFLIESAVSSAPANDDFVDAEVIAGEYPLSVLGANDDGIGGLGATKEAGEPAHGGDAGGGSIWYSWTPTESGRVSVSTDGSSFDTLLAVYTGSAVNALAPVSQYPNLNFPASSADAPFHPASYVEFMAEAGTTYYLAVDGEAGEFGSVDLTIDSNFTTLDPVAELLPASSSWEYLFLTELVGLANVPVDPETLDPDFDTTWQTASGYDGPAFSGPAPALFGYGVVNGHSIVTDLWGGLDNDGDGLPDPSPDALDNDTAYFRTTFTPAGAVVNVGFEGLVDDGAVIYFDGVEVARMNVDAAKDANDFLILADGTTVDNALGVAVNDEDAPQVAYALGQNLPAGVEVEVAVSLHNASVGSSDLGFDLRIWSVNEPLVPPAPPALQLFIAKSTFPGEYEISWNSSTGMTYGVDYSTDLVNWEEIAFGIAADASGITLIPDIPPAADTTGYYRVREE